MRLIFTLIAFLFACFSMFAQNTQEREFAVEKCVVRKDNNVKVFIRCGTILRDPSEGPLLIIDSRPRKMEMLASINPNDIEEVFIMKADKAKAIYGPDGANGAIIVTTKSSKVREFIIKDFLTGDEIPAASIRFIRQPLQKDSLHFVSNDSGFISTNKLVIGGEYEAVITSTGYKPLAVKFNTGYTNKQMILLLEKDAKGSIYKDEETAQKVASASPVAIFPNPVTRGQSVTIEMESAEQKSLQAIVTDFSGKTLLQQNFSAAKGVNRFTVNTDSRWPAGIYLLHWKNEKGIVLQTQQIVVR